MSGFESAIEHCTNEKRTDEDWGLILDICERVERTPNGARDSLRCVIKRLRHRVPHVAMATLTLLDAMVKNCGKPFRREMSSRDFVADAKAILSNKNTHPKVAQRFRFLIKKWAENEFKGDSELDLFVSGLYQQLVRDGAKFDYTEDSKLKDESRRKALVQEEEDIAKAIALSLDDGKKSRTTATTKTPTTTSSAPAASTSLYPSFSAPVNPMEPAKEPRKVRALYDFEAVEDNELTFKAGEIIIVSDDSDANWWKGSNHRGEGLFPATFVSTDLDAKPESVEGSAKTVSFNEEVAVVEEMPAGSSASLEPVTIDERCIDDCLAMLENADPTGEMKPDPPELLPLESRCRQMAPLIDNELEKIDRRHNTLAEMNVRLMEALQMYNQLMAAGSGPSMPMMGTMKMEVPPGAMPPPPGQMVAPPVHPQPTMLPQMPGPPPAQSQAPPQPSMMFPPPGMYMPPPQGNNNAAIESQPVTQQNGVMPHPVQQQPPFFAPAPHPHYSAAMPANIMPPQAPSQSPLL